MTGYEYNALFSRSPEKAYKALFDEYCNYVYAIVYNKLRSCAAREDVEECVSDIFADVFFGYNSENAYQGDLKGYIGTVAKRKAINKYRKLSPGAGKTISLDDSNIGEIRSENDAQSEAEKKALCNFMIEKITELGEPDSTIIIQKYYYDRSSAEIAKALSMKPSAIRMRCVRAMKKLNKMLEGFDVTL